MSIGHGRVRYRGILEDPNELALALVIALPFAMTPFAQRRSLLNLFLLGLGMFLDIFSALVIMVPLILLMAASVALDGHTPFYAQKRIGRGAPHRWRGGAAGAC